MSGSLMSPFQPTVVRGFSLYPKISEWSAIRRNNGQVGAHDDVQIGHFGHELFEKSRVLDGLIGAVDGAWSNNDQDTIVMPSKNASSVVASTSDCFACIRCRHNFVLEQGGLHKRIVLEQ